MILASSALTNDQLTEILMLSMPIFQARTNKSRVILSEIYSAQLQSKIVRSLVFNDLKSSDEISKHSFIITQKSHRIVIKT